MARYPTYEEYAKRGAFTEGIKRCDELLHRNPTDTQLLITKLQLLCNSNGNWSPVLDQLSASQPPVRNYQELVPIEAAVVAANRDIFPPPLTAGPAVGKLWDVAFKSTSNPQDKLDLLAIRFSRAVIDNRIADSQQALIAWKAFQPKDRSAYMAHAAYTQLLSTSKEDLQSRLALGLARRSVSENFDDEKGLDCRVPGQIFAIQMAEKDLEGIRDRTFRESKHVYDALGLSEKVGEENQNGEANGSSLDPAKTTPRDRLYAEVVGLKAEFSKLVSLEQPVPTLEQFVSKTVTLLHRSLTDLAISKTRGTADLCFLAISGLVKLYTLSTNQTFLLQAAFLAEKLLRRNEHVHEARLVLVYLYMRLNLGSLAMQFFDSLSVKEIQHDTVGHVLFTRISATHPFRTQLPSRDWFEPHERTQKALAIYPRHEDKLSEMEASVLDHGQSGMIFDLNSLRKDLRTSLARRMTLLEHRRTARLTGKGFGKHTAEIGPRRLANWMKLKDNRDFNAAFDYGFNVERPLYGDTGELWLLYTLAADTAACLASGQTPLILDADHLLKSLISNDSEALVGGEFTSAESRAASVITPTLTLLLAAKSEAITQTHIDDLHAAVEGLPISALINATNHLAEHLQDYYIYTDALKIVLNACHLSSVSSGRTVLDTTKLQNLSKRSIGQLQNSAQEQLARLNSRDVQARLLDGEGGALREAFGLFGQDSLKEFAELVVGSAREGWEGVGKISVR